MKIFHALTAILILLKVLGVAQISWFVALAPSLITVSIAIIIFILAMIMAVLVDK